MIEKLLPAITALLGGAIALLATWLTAYWNEKQREKERDWRISDDKHQLLIERGEELYSLFDAWNRASTAPFLFYRRVMRGEINYNDALDAVVESAKSRDDKLERIELLSEVYFPELNENIRKARHFFEKSNEVEDDFRLLYKAGETSSVKHEKEFTENLVMAERELGNAKLALAAHLREAIESRS